MNRRLLNYIIVWAVIFVAFTACAWIIPFEHGDNFVIGYVSVNISFIIQFGCGILALKDDNNNKFVLRVPLLITSYVWMLLTLAVGIDCIFTMYLPSWLQIVSCILTLALSIICDVKANYVGDEVNDNQEKGKKKIAKMNIIIAKVSTLASENNDVNKKIKELKDLLRYSDPVSSEATFEYEVKIEMLIEDIKENIKADDVDKKIDKLIGLIKERNSVCKSSK